ncbi:single-stranded DNA-binding protein [Actinosynnema sp. NPDC050436]|uniref:single-stranded DNA-binding protein n=1 Tax=Actinosynnema sp. NPDC050436 TaxID=3155659 RepID=UPI0033CF5687
MAYNDTRITVCGTVASKVAHTKVGTGFSRAGFRVHSREQRFDPERRDWSAGSDMFLMVTCWRELADNVHESLSRGDPVVVHGKVRIREFDDNGRTRQLVDVEALAVGPDLASCTAQPVRPRDDGPVVVPPRREDELPLAFAGVSLNRPTPPRPHAPPEPGPPSAVEPPTPVTLRGPAGPPDRPADPVPDRPPAGHAPDRPPADHCHHVPGRLPADGRSAPDRPPADRLSNADQPQEVS